MPLAGSGRVSSLLVRGLLAGLVAGALGFVFAHTFGEPQVRRAIAFESRQEAAAGRAPEPEIVSRDVQSTAGLGLGVVVYGTAFGGLFALAFAVVNGRLGRVGARAMSGLLALCGFGVVYLVPFLKYPANPPAVGDPATIGHRSALFLAMIGLSLLAAVAAVRVGRSLRVRLGAWNATLTAFGTYLAIVGLGMWVLPGVDEVPASFPASVLWWFRVSALGTQFVLWTTIGLVFGAMTERALAAADHPSERSVLVGTS